MNMKCLFKECALDDKDGRVTPPPETDGRQKIVHEASREVDGGLRPVFWEALPSSRRETIKALNEEPGRVPRICRISLRGRRLTAGRSSYAVNAEGSLHV